MKYEQALLELEMIADKMENGDCSIDELSSQIKKARQLIKLCKDKLKKTTDEVKEMVSDDAEE